MMATGWPEDWELLQDHHLNDLPEGSGASADLQSV